MKPMTSSTLVLHRKLAPHQVDVRARILSTARKLIQRHGHEAVGMEQVARASRVSRATVYRYFASKEHIVCEVSLAWGQVAVERLQVMGAAAPSPRESLQAAIEFIVQEAASDLPMLRATMASVLAQGPVADQFRAGLRSLFGALVGGSLPATGGERELSFLLLGRVFFADLALVAVGDLSAEDCVNEISFAAERFVPSA